MPKHKSEDYKLSAVKYYLKSKKTQEDICNIFNCSPRSLKRWTTRYSKDKTIKRYNRKPISYKVKKTHVKFILDEVTKNKTITMDDLLSNLKSKYPTLKISRYHVNRIINDNNYSLKLTRIRHEPILRFGKPIEINNKLKEFYNEIKKYNLDNIICVDETSISGLQIRYHCYNKIGKRCIIKTQSQDVFKKYTAIFAISSKGIEGFELYDKGGIDTNRLKTFLEINILNKYRHKLIILDNASSHRNEIIKNLINQNNKVLYSIPYQHYTNSIEGFFSVLKSKLRKLQGLTYNELKNNINIAVNQIPKNYYIKILKYAYDRPKKYIRKVSNRIKTLKNYKK
jgi:transposase-like protein